MAANSNKHRTLELSEDGTLRQRKHCNRETVLRCSDLVRTSIMKREMFHDKPKTAAAEELIRLRQFKASAMRALDMLGVALAGHNHTWTPDERKAYEDATAGAS